MENLYLVEGDSLWIRETRHEQLFLCFPTGKHPGERETTRHKKIYLIFGDHQGRRDDTCQVFCFTTFNVTIS